MALTVQQQQVVDSTTKRTLVLSCAGSGKTTVITLRIAKLWDDGVKPDEILALTFSSKAAQEMKKRVCKENPKLGSRVNVRTFHSFGLDIIRKFNLAFGFTGPVKIAKNSECKSILAEILKKRGDVALAGEELEAYLKRCKSCEPYGHNPKFDTIFSEYCKILLERNLVDMDDMIWLPVQFMTENPDVKKIVSEQYKYVFVDEYQDTNEAQNRLLDLIVNENTNICLVGDDDQAIYEWRGARPKYIRAKAESGEYSLIKLETNFRSQQAVIDAANSIINKNKKRVTKAINADRPLLYKPIYARLKSQEGEAAYVATKIKELIDKEKYSASDIAVLCRINKQIEPIKLALDSAGINSDCCEIDENAQYGHFVSVLQSIVDMNSLNDLGNAINFPNNCFDQFVYMDAKSAYCDEYGQGIEYTDLEWLDRLYNSDVFFENCDDFRERFGMIQQLHDATTWLPTQVIALYITFMERKHYDADYPEQYHFLLQVFDIAKNYEEAFENATVREFLYHLNLTLGLGDIAKGTNYDAVNILTMHRAKGLEFKVVFIVGVQVGVCPNDFFVRTEEDLEAERRLFYVALTRAKDLLFLTSYQDPLGGSFKSPFITHGFMAEIPQVVFGDEAEYVHALKTLPKKEKAKEDNSNAANDISAVVKETISNFTKSAKGGSSYEDMRDALFENKRNAEKQDDKSKKKWINSAVMRKYPIDKIDNLKLNEFCDLFTLASVDNIPRTMSTELKELAKEVSSLDGALQKYPDEEQLSHKFLDYYIPESTKLLYSYIEYDKASVSSEILKPVENEVMKSIDEVSKAISVRVDDIYKIATMDTKARADALRRIIAKDGYANA